MTESKKNGVNSKLPVYIFHCTCLLVLLYYTVTVYHAWSKNYFEIHFLTGQITSRQVFYIKDYWVSMSLFSKITSQSHYQWLKFCFCVRKDTHLSLKHIFFPWGNLLIIYYLHKRSFNNHHNCSQMSSEMTSCPEWGQTRKQIINSLNIRKCVSTLWTQRGIFNISEDMLIKNVIA